MRILYLNPCAEMGGAETSLLELLASMRAAEPEWSLSLIIGAEGPLVRKAAELGVHVVVVPFPFVLAQVGDSASVNFATLVRGFMAAIQYRGQLARAIKAKRPDLIHSTGFKMHLLSAWSGPKRIPVIWHVHDYVRSRRLMSRLLRWNAGRCAALIANSRSVAADLQLAVGPKVRIQTIYNAINLERFSPEGHTADLDVLSGLPPAAPGTIKVGLLATFAWWKGHRTFIKALSILPENLPIRGYIIGGPIYQTDGSQHSLAELREESAQLGLTNRLGFTSFVDNAASALRALDIVVHASTSPEPFGMAIIEGMACGKAVIASQAGGAAEIFTDGVDALGHLPGDAASLSGQIARLAQDSDMRMQFGQAGRVRVETAFEKRRLAREVSRLYRHCCGDEQGAPADAVVAQH